MRFNGFVKFVAIKDAVDKKRVKTALWIAGHARNLHRLGRVHHFVLDKHIFRVQRMRIADGFVTEVGILECPVQWTANVLDTMRDVPSWQGVVGHLHRRHLHHHHCHFATLGRPWKSW